MPDYITRTTCRVCGSNHLSPLFSLGEQYVSDFITQEEIGTKGIKCPIDLVMCEKCTLIQLKHTAPQEFLYTRHYWYKSGVTQMMRKALQDVAEAAKSSVPIHHGSIALDIGSNDGTLLRCYPNWLFKTVGVEPARNLAEEGSKGIGIFINDFWNYEKFIEATKGEQALIITAIGMLYDLENPNQFIADIAKALRFDGVFIAQLMCLNNMISTCDIGNLAHEHLEFYSLMSLEYLLDQHGLEIYDVETNATNNQSYRFYIRHIGSPVKAENAVGAAARIHYIRLEEDKLLNKRFYEFFFARMEANKARILGFIGQAKEQGKSIWVYGASTKGNTILQYLGLNKDLIDGASDKSPEKWGRYTIGSNIPIFSHEMMRQHLPDYCLVLPYTFISEIIKDESQQQWRLSGGKFIQPLPEMRII